MSVIITLTYNNSGHAESCLRSYSGCAKDIVVVRRDSEPVEIECLMTAPDTLRANLTSGGYDPDTFPVTLTLTNRGREALFPGQARLEFSGMGLVTVPLNDNMRPLSRLDPGQSVVLTWTVHADRRARSRMVELAVRFTDAIGELPVYCAHELFIEGLPALDCVLSAPDTLRFDPGTGQIEPNPFALHLNLVNRIDSVVGKIEAVLDIAAMTSLELGTGEKALKIIALIPNGQSRSLNWTIQLASIPSNIVSGPLVVHYRHERDTVWRTCEHLITIIPPIGDLSCTLTGPDTLTIADTTYLPANPVLDYSLHNTGNQGIEADHIALNISAGSGVISMDPLVLAGVSLNPGQTANEQWRLRALASAYSRYAQLTVTAFDDRDSVLSQCIHDILIPGIDGLRCLLAAPDTVRFNKEELRYEPDPVSLRFELRNALDTAYTNIEAEIDYSFASRLTLAPGETATQTLSLHAGHEPVYFTWLLSPQPGDETEQQQIVVRYRSDQQAEWKECTVSTIIEAWPRITTTDCETGGHDSLYADNYYEQWIPDPISLSYRVTNTGTVTLTDCRASIVLPTEFALAGSDIEQKYGTLVPGASAIRWWDVSPTMQLTEFKAYTIGWEWTSLEQGTQTGCDHIVHVVPDSPSGIVLTPLYLHFEAKYAEALPASRQVQLWTGGGLAMPWTAQPGGSWLDVQPVSGSVATQLRVQPNTTLLPEGIYGTDITVNATVQGQSRRISVTYLIDDVTDVTDPVQARSFRLDQSWPNPVSLSGSGTTITFHLGKSGRTVLRLYDVMGREVVTMLDADMEAGSHAVRFSPSDLTPGMYFYRLTGSETNAIRSMMVVR